MAFESYITYQEYQALGGKLSVTDFPLYERKAQRRLDFITFNRIPLLDTIPDEVKEVLTEFTDKVFVDDKTSSSSSSSASSYSNGVETVQFKEDASSAFMNDLTKTAITFLPDYLTARSVNFDVRKYLQSDSNDSE